MKGQNTIELNQATVIEALNLWAEKHFKEPVEIASVQPLSGTLGGGLRVVLKAVPRVGLNRTPIPQREEEDERYHSAQPL